MRWGCADQPKLRVSSFPCGLQKLWESRKTSSKSLNVFWLVSALGPMKNSRSNDVYCVTWTWCDMCRMDCRLPEIKQKITDCCSWRRQCRTTVAVFRVKSIDKISILVYLVINRSKNDGGQRTRGKIFMCTLCLLPVVTEPRKHKNVHKFIWLLPQFSFSVSIYQQIRMSYGEHCLIQLSDRQFNNNISASMTVLKKFVQGDVFKMTD